MPLGLTSASGACDLIKVHCEQSDMARVGVRTKFILHAHLGAMPGSQRFFTCRLHPVDFNSVISHRGTRGRCQQKIMSIIQRAKITGLLETMSSLVCLDAFLVFIFLCSNPERIRLLLQEILSF